MRCALIVLLAACNQDKALGGVASNTALTADTHIAFPIGHDAKHAGVDCNVCHGGFDSFKQYSCTSGCHEQAACDSGHPGLEAYRYDSAACLSCHPGGVADGTFSGHPFPIDAASIHSGIACKTCHVVSGDYTKFSCTSGCHTAPATDPIHVGLADYAYDSPRCLACHPAGVGVAPADHDVHFPIGAGTAHSGIACGDCHTNKTQTANAANYKCATCHASIDPNLLTKHTTTTSSTKIHVKAKELSLTDARTCLRCHAKAHVDLTSQHPSRAPCQGAGKPPHQNAGCTDCHSGYLSAPAYAADFSGATPPGCVQCHENNQVCH